MYRTIDYTSTLLLPYNLLSAVSILTTVKSLNMSSYNKPWKKDTFPSAKEYINLKSELERKNKRIEELENRKSLDDANIQDLEVRIKRRETEKEFLLERLRSLEGEHDIVKKRVNHLEEKVQELEKEAGHPPTPATAAEGSVGVPDGMSLPYLPDKVENASLVLGELCCQVQAMMYQEVLPNYYEYWKSYKVKHIEEDIDDDFYGEQHKKEAKKRWVELKKKLNWNNKTHRRAMKSIQESRNVTAHPELNEELLDVSAKLMEQAGKLTDWHSPACVRELIEMWKQLTLKH